MGADHRKQLEPGGTLYDLITSHCFVLLQTEAPGLPVEVHIHLGAPGPDIQAEGVAIARVAFGIGVDGWALCVRDADILESWQPIQGDEVCWGLNSGDFIVQAFRLDADRIVTHLFFVQAEPEDLPAVEEYRLDLIG